MDLLMRQWVLIQPNGTKSIPISTSQLRELCKQGIIHQDTKISRAMNCNFAPIKTIKQFRDIYVLTPKTSVKKCDMNNEPTDIIAKANDTTSFTTPAIIDIPETTKSSEVTLPATKTEKTQSIITYEPPINDDNIRPMTTPKLPSNSGDEGLKHMHDLLFNTTSDTINLRDKHQQEIVEVVQTREEKVISPQKPKPHSQEKNLQFNEIKTQEIITSQRQKQSNNFIETPISPLKVGMIPNKSTQKSRDRIPHPQTSTDIAHTSLETTFTDNNDTIKRHRSSIRALSASKEPKHYPRESAIPVPTDDTTLSSLPVPEGMAFSDYVYLDFLPTLKDLSLQERNALLFHHRLLLRGYEEPSIDLSIQEALKMVRKKMEHHIKHQFRSNNEEFLQYITSLFSEKPILQHTGPDMNMMMIGSEVHPQTDNFPQPFSPTPHALPAPHFPLLNPFQLSQHHFALNCHLSLYRGHILHPLVSLNHTSTRLPHRIRDTNFSPHIAPFHPVGYRLVLPMALTFPHLPVYAMFLQHLREIQHDIFTTIMNNTQNIDTTQCRYISIKNSHEIIDTFPPGPFIFIDSTFGQISFNPLHESPLLTATFIPRKNCYPLRMVIAEVIPFILKTATGIMEPLDWNSTDNTPESHDNELGDDPSALPLVPLLFLHQPQSSLLYEWGRSVIVHSCQNPHCWSPYCFSLIPRLDSNTIPMDTPTTDNTLSHIPSTAEDFTYTLNLVDYAYFKVFPPLVDFDSTLRARMLFHHRVLAQNYEEVDSHLPLPSLLAAVRSSSSSSIPSRFHQNDDAFNTYLISLYPPINPESSPYKDHRAEQPTSIKFSPDPTALPVQDLVLNPLRMTNHHFIHQFPDNTIDRAYIPQPHIKLDRQNPVTVPPRVRGGEFLHTIGLRVSLTMALAFPQVPAFSLFLHHLREIQSDIYAAIAGAIMPLTRRQTSKTCRMLLPPESEDTNPNDQKLIIPTSFGIINIPPSRSILESTFRPARNCYPLRMVISEVTPHLLETPKSILSPLLWNTEGDTGDDQSSELGDEQSSFPLAPLLFLHTPEAVLGYEMGQFKITQSCSTVHCFNPYCLAFVQKTDEERNLSLITSSRLEYNTHTLTYTENHNNIPLHHFTHLQVIPSLEDLSSSDRDVLLAQFRSYSRRYNEPNPRQHLATIIAQVRDFNSHYVNMKFHQSSMEFGTFLRSHAFPHQAQGLDLTPLFSTKSTVLSKTQPFPFSPISYNLPHDEIIVNPLRPRYFHFSDIYGYKESERPYFPQSNITLHFHNSTPLNTRTRVIDADPTPFTVQTHPVNLRIALTFAFAFPNSPTNIMFMSHLRQIQADIYNSITTHESVPLSEGKKCRQLHVKMIDTLYGRINFADDDTSLITASFTPRINCYPLTMVISEIGKDNFTSIHRPDLMWNTEGGVKDAPDLAGSALCDEQSSVSLAPLLFLHIPAAILSYYTGQTTVSGCGNAHCAAPECLSLSRVDLRKITASERKKLLQAQKTVQDVTELLVMGDSEKFQQFLPQNDLNEEISSRKDAFTSSSQEQQLDSQLKQLPQIPLSSNLHHRIAFDADVEPCIENTLTTIPSSSNYILPIEKYIYLQKIPPLSHIDLSCRRYMLFQHRALARTFDEVNSLLSLPEILTKTRQALKPFMMERDLQTNAQFKSYLHCLFPWYKPDTTAKKTTNDHNTNQTFIDSFHFTPTPQQMPQRDIILNPFNIAIPLFKNRITNASITIEHLSHSTITLHHENRMPLLFRPRRRHGLGLTLPLVIIGLRVAIAATLAYPLSPVSIVYFEHLKQIQQDIFTTIMKATRLCNFQRSNTVMDHDSSECRELTDNSPKSIINTTFGAISFDPHSAPSLSTARFTPRKNCYPLRMVLAEIDFRTLKTMKSMSPPLNWNTDDKDGYARKESSSKLIGTENDNELGDASSAIPLAPLLFLHIPQAILAYELGHSKVSHTCLNDACFNPHCLIMEKRTETLPLPEYDPQSAIFIGNGDDIAVDQLDQNVEKSQQLQPQPQANPFDVLTQQVNQYDGNNNQDQFLTSQDQNIPQEDQFMVNDYISVNQNHNNQDDNNIYAHGDNDEMCNKFDRNQQESLQSQEQVQLLSSQLSQSPQSTQPMITELQSHTLSKQSSTQSSDASESTRTNIAKRTRSTRSPQYQSQNADNIDLYRQDDSEKTNIKKFRANQ